MEEKNKKKITITWRAVNIAIAVFDLLAFSLSYLIALWIRYDGIVSSINETYLSCCMSFSPVYIVVSFVVFYLLKLYNSIWKYASESEFIRTLIANAITSAINVIVTCLFYVRMPLSYYVIGTVIQFLITLGIRFAYRLFVNIRNTSYSKKNKNRCMLVGAGSAGQMIIKELNNSKSGKDYIVCAIDDNPDVLHQRLDGIEVVGNRDTISENIRKYNVNKIIVAIPSASAKTRKEILDLCNKTGLEVKNIPSYYRFTKEDLKISSIKDVQIEDLLGREEVKIDMKEVFDNLSGKTIIVTGGGGSIGSELSRQVAAHNPKCLVIFDIYENNAYDIQNELKDKYKDLNLVTLIGSVRDTDKVLSIFKKYKPDIVFHAAAHKHVPLMEDSPCEAVKNNILGTYNVALASLVYKAKRMVLISTDKAVNPTNVMGATKRACEMIIQSFNSLIIDGKQKEVLNFYKNKPNVLIPAKPITVFSAVRFGNVLGSNGSVIPLFRKQIENGGPLTVTDPNIVRYFMTIPEAVSLVLQSSVYSKGGEIFVLDMGEPVKIDDLARKMIELSGKKPDEDIKIVYTGLRPGEKMYEEKLMSEEGLDKTRNDLIFIGHPLSVKPKEFIKQAKELLEIASTNNLKATDNMLAKIVVTYRRIR